jgi:hypothetical protein
MNLEVETKFQPKELIALTGKEDVGMHYRCWYSDRPLKVRYIQDEEVRGKTWHVFVTAVHYDNKPVIIRVRVPIDKTEPSQEGIYAGNSIITRKILSKRKGEPHWYYSRTDTINDFIDKAWELFKDDDSPKVSALKEALKSDYC